MNSENTQLNALLTEVMAQADSEQYHVLDMNMAQQGECDLRRQLRQRTVRYTAAVGSRLEQITRRKNQPDIDWQHLDISNALSRRRFSQPGFDLVLLSAAPAEPALWYELLKPGGWLIAGNDRQWQRWQPQTEASPPFPLTDIQHAYWIGRSQSLALGGVSCHVYFEWRISDFDIARFEAAWNRVIARHGMMRACVDDNGQQRILASVPHYAIACDDLRALPDQLRDRQLAATRERMSQQVLEASQWPLFELRASLESEQDCRVHLDLDLLTFDVQSFHIVLAELARFYHQPQLSLAEIRYSFRDYQLAEMQARHSSGWASDRDWWLARLDQLHPAPQLPLRCQPSEVAQPKFRRLQRRVEPERWQRLSQHASQAGVTPSAMLLAAFSELLTLWCEEPRFSLNLTHFNRRPHHADVAQLVGDFTSVLLLSVDCSTRQPFRQRAADLQQTLWERLAHSQFGGVDVLRELAKRQGMADSSAMPIVFTSLLGMDLDTLVEGADLLGEPAYLYTATPQVWLDHQVMVRKGSLEYNWIVIDNLFPDGMIDSMFAAYGELLDRLTDDSQLWQQPLALPLPDKQRAIRTAVNRTELMLPLTPLHAGFFARARQQPTATALIAEGQQWQYQQLAQLALRVAARLNQLECRNQPVVVSLPKGAGQIIAALGVMAAGAILVPVARDWPLARLHEVLDQAGAQALISDDDGVAQCSQTTAFTLQQLPPQGAEVQLPPLSQTAYIIYTSGSTGKPKGVAMQHAATANTLSDISARLQLTPDDRVFGLSSLSFDLAIFDLFATLAAGATLVLPQQQGMRDAAHWMQLLQQHQVSCWNSVPSLMAMLVEYARASGESLPALRAVMLSGDWIGRDLAASIAPLAPAARLIALGGATEAAIWSNWFEVESVDPHWYAVPYGWPLANQRYYVLDAQGRDRPAGVAGELFIGGVGLAAGYWRDTARTDAAFITHPLSGERLYRTGDLARYDPQGCIEFLGRRDAQVKVGGHRIELGEIEAALQATEQVQSAVADVVTTPSGAQQLAAWLVIKPLAQDAAQLIATGQQAAACLPASSRIASLSAFQAESESLAPLMMLQILQQLEFCQPPGWRIAARMSELRLDARFSRLLTRWHQILQQEGLLNEEGGQWFCADCAPAEQALAQRLDDGRHRLRQFLSWLNEGDLFADWLFASSTAIETVLKEPQLASSLLFPDGDSRASEALYQGNIIADYLGAIAASLLPQLVNGHPAPQVMEIGAGIGGLTASTLPAFAALTEQGEYHHTDVSPWFSHYATQRFGGYPALRTGRYDINQTAAEQHYAPATMDAILAANVLHNAHQPDATLSEIWLMLKPGGSLLMLEATEDKQLQWVTAAAVLEHAAEGGDSAGDSPLLSESQWRSALLRAGFELIDVWPYAATPLAFAGQQLFLARRPQQATTLQQVQQSLAQRLPAYMLPDHLISVAKLPLSANGKIDRQQLPKIAQLSGAQQQHYAAPQTDAEQRLAAIWCELLQVEQVGREQDFFSAGGDSLLATRLASRLSSEWGVRVPIRLIFTDAVLHKMATALEAVVAPTLALPLVELSATRPQQLICLHGSDGFATPYQRLAAALSDSVQCIGVQASGLLMDETPLSNLDSQAQRTLDALRQQGFSGPWHLAGWSMGAYLAMEMARRLQQQGEQVASLILIDPAPQQAMAACAASEYALWRSMAGESVASQLTTFAALCSEEKLARWREVLPPDLLIEDQALTRLIAVIRANVQAMVSAPCRPLTVAAEIITASERDLSWGDGSRVLEQWFSVTPQRSTIGNSNHLNIITQPQLFAALQQITQGKQ
ncbi:amino acid adenylation domain-containing protein [Erwiniaceae bacterium BAC15a-03b]|uniref:Amino acid adenylation domain-containing protein n=1 Tax=Winslowiella arboricola TaxID=2978220 RepID=A0A9J6PMW3_9GAMM|nr:non-ribosomal peptide synthetase [Winslowiella arboricola]MCU5775501.1 amino acid adenylation domain-containing protein [Winslowiella arboricola]MCU5779649.1 amino acid adenylation domain-containing protein [Winslowiella arboricola]